MNINTICILSSITICGLPLSSMEWLLDTNFKITFLFSNPQKLSIFTDFFLKDTFPFLNFKSNTEFFLEESGFSQNYNLHMHYF